MRPKIYLETTIASYLTARTSRNILVAAHQQITRRWWRRRNRFELFVSQAVLQEAARGDAVVAARRLAAMEGLPVLAVDSAATELSERLVRSCALPPKAQMDAVHIAVSVLNGMDYLLTWNCTHIANATLRGKIEETCRDEGLQAPIICTPEELEA
jgi:hypothetical protein